MWILENEMYHHGGDSVQVGHGGGNLVVGLYVGRNVMHHDRENAVDLKEVSNAVVSENTMYGYRETGSSEGAAVVIHYCPINASILNNLIYDSQVGISSTSLNSTCSGQQVTNRIMGNVVQGSIGAAIQGWGTGKTTQIANNTVYNAGAEGIDITNAGLGSFAENNIVVGTRGIVGTGMTQRNNVTSNPGFVNAAGGDFRLASGSSAIDAGIASSAYSGFQSVYGVSAAVDRDGRARPGGGGWDVGAYESNGTPGLRRSAGAAGGADQRPHHPLDDSLDSCRSGRHVVVRFGNSAFTPTLPSRRSPRPGVSAVAGQINRHPQTAHRRRVERDAAAVRVDEVAHDRQAEA